MDRLGIKLSRISKLLVDGCELTMEEALSRRQRYRIRRREMDTDAQSPSEKESRHSRRMTFWLATGAIVSRSPISKDGR